MNNLDVKIFSVDGTIPEYVISGSSGVDLKSNDSITILPMSSALLSTGIHVAIPEGYEGQVRSRSGLAAKHNLFVLNSPGTIDASYRGEIKIILYNAGNYDYTVNVNDRVAQLVFCPVMILNEFTIVKSIEELGETERADGGFGSTGYGRKENK